MAEPLYLTPREYAARLGVRVHQVLGWIHAGELAAIDVSSRPGTGRPTWRIPLAAVEEWTLRRTARAAPERPTPKRRRVTAHKRWF